MMAMIFWARLLLPIAVFGLVMGVWLVALVLWRIRQEKYRKQIQTRLAIPSEQGSERTRTLHLWHDSHDSTVMVPREANQASPIRRLNALCKEAGWETPGVFLLLASSMVAALVCAVLLVVTDHLLAGLFGFVTTLMIAWAVLQRNIERQRELFDTQLTDALDLACRSLRAGHPLMGAFQLVAEEIPKPVGPIFDTICKQHMMGLSLEDAVHTGGMMSPSEDMKLFVASLSMQMRSGGNLTHMIERVTSVIRERMRLSRRIRILTAQTQFGKRILIALPFVLMVVLSVMNPKYIQPLYNTLNGQIMLAIGGVSVLLGSMIMNRMATLKY
jgi:tight adherence protein B